MCHKRSYSCGIPQSEQAMKVRWYLIEHGTEQRFNVIFKQLASIFSGARHAQNCVNASSNHVYNAAVPKRSAKFNWTKPVDGLNPATEWQGYLRFDEPPQLENPECGFLQNCDQSPLSTTPVGRKLRAGEVDENPKASQFPPYAMATERERDNPRVQISRSILHSTAQFAYDDWTRDRFNTKIL